MPERVTEHTGNNGPTKDLYEEVLAEHLTHEVALRRVQQAMKTNLGRYESAGGDKAEIKLGAKLHRMDGGEARAYIGRINRAAAWSGVVTWDDSTGQGGFAATFDAPASPQSSGVRCDGTLISISAAEVDGYNTGNQGFPKDANPYAHKPGSREFVQWVANWELGQEDRIAAGKPALNKQSQANAKQADDSRDEPQAPKRRGRPPKNAAAANGAAAAPEPEPVPLPPGSPLEQAPQVH